MKRLAQLNTMQEYLDVLKALNYATGYEMRRFAILDDASGCYELLGEDPILYFHLIREDIRDSACQWFFEDEQIVHP